MKIKLYSLLILGLLAMVFHNCTSDFTKNLGGGYFFRNEGGEIKDILCQRPDGGQIPSTVLSYAYDRKFIIAKQKPDLPQDILYKKEYDYKFGEDTIYFWLIVKKGNLVIGPLIEEEFKEVKKEYNVPDRLNLD